MFRCGSVSSAPLLALAAFVAIGSVAIVARSDGGHFVPSAFFVAKSENRNQVHYGINVDGACSPVGTEPVVAYWRMFEHGPAATEPLLLREVPAYGVAEQHVGERGEGGGRVTIRLNALGSRPVDVTTALRDGVCVTTATTTIGGQPATLSSVFVQLRWPFGVDYLGLSGKALADGRPLHERLSP